MRFARFDVSVQASLWVRGGRSGVDSRLRGNDVGGCGSDVGGGITVAGRIYDAGATCRARRKIEWSPRQRIIDHRPQLVLSYSLYGERGQVG